MGFEVGQYVWYIEGEWRSDTPPVVVFTVIVEKRTIKVGKQYGIRSSNGDLFYVRADKFEPYTTFEDAEAARQQIIRERIPKLEAALAEHRAALEGA